MTGIVTLLLALAVLAGPVALAQHVLPSFIKPCSVSSPDFEKCLKDVTQAIIPEFTKGIKELDIPSIDPVSLNKINIDLPSLKVVFSDVTLHGLSNSRVNEFKKNLVAKRAHFDWTSNLVMKGHYKVDGRVVVLPIQGEGDFTINLTNMSFILKYKMDTVKGLGDKDYWFLNVYKQSYRLDRARFDLKNLFNGNEFLADTTLRFINENWDLIMKDIAPPAVEQIVAACVNVANKFFAKVPVENLMLP